MSEQLRSDRIKSAREEFKGVIGGNEETAGGSRFVYLKTKSSQSDKTVTNSVTVKDQLTDAKYVVSVSATMSGEDPSSETLLALQASIAKFLQSIHEGL